MQPLFQDHLDYQRMYYSIFILNNSKRKATRGINPREMENISPHDNFLDIIAYCLMPNHFHLLVRQKIDRGVSRFMHRLGDSYSKYLNTRFDRYGHLFGGAYKIRAVEKTSYLLHASRYIHANPSDLFDKQKWEQTANYPYSSLQTYLGTKFDNHLITQPVSDHFQSEQQYAGYVRDYINSKTVPEELF